MTIASPNPPLVSIVPLKDLILNYIRQDYYSSRFMLFVSNINLLTENTLRFIQSTPVQPGQQTLSSGSPLLAIELGTLKELITLSKELISYNKSLITDTEKTVNTDCDKRIDNETTQVEFYAFALGIQIGSDQYLDTTVRQEFLESGKTPVFFDIQRTASRIPVIGVGGGSMSNLLACRYVLSSRKQLKRSLFMRHSGDLANSKNQALVPLLESDLIIEASGTKPLDVANKDMTLRIFRVVAIHETKVECEEVTEKLDRSYIPKKVVTGAHIYHNRDGSYFCSEIKAKRKGDVEGL